MVLKKIEFNVFLTQKYTAKNITFYPASENVCKKKSQAGLVETLSTVELYTGIFLKESNRWNVSHFITNCRMNPEPKIVFSQTSDSFMSCLQFLL